MSLNEIQSKDASQNRDETRWKYASHDSSETHFIYASHSLGETQSDDASHNDDETHLEHASHEAGETHREDASQKMNETHFVGALLVATPDEGDNPDPDDGEGGKRKPTTEDSEIKAMVDLYYDLQKTRISMGNRLDAIKRGVSNESENDYTRIDKIFHDAEHLEKELIPIFELFTRGKHGMKWLSKIRGIGPVLSAAIIAIYGDCGGFETVSKLWAWSGLAVVDGHAPRRHKGQRDQWNPEAKVLAWKIGKSFAWQRGNYYSDFYRNAKLEYAKRADLTQGKGWKGHIDAMARRKTVKLFLSHWWVQARTEAGLPVSKPWVFGPGGHDESHYISGDQA